MVTSYKIGILVPCTSRGRDLWLSICDSYFLNLTMKHLLLTQDKEHHYTFYIGGDNDDRIFGERARYSKQELAKYSYIYQNVSFEIVHFDIIERGHLTKMWNILFQKAYDDGCDYFYQCGDDIEFQTNGWVNDCIKVLREHGGIGLAGPINNNFHILTQAFVSRKHMEIFGWFFPEEIINWCCDDWYNLVYSPDYFFPLRNHYCSNNGGEPRYTINNSTEFVRDLAVNTQKLRLDTALLAEKHKVILLDYISKNR